MVQDDVEFCRGVREYLEAVLWPARRVGVVSIYRSSVNASTKPGLQLAEPARGLVGALAYIFPGASVRNLLSDPQAVFHRRRANGLFAIDEVIGRWSVRRKLPAYNHSPSLVQHTGDVSTVWDNASNSGYRRASDFPGSDFSAIGLSNKAVNSQSH